MGDERMKNDEYSAMVHETELYSVIRVSQKELAQFMGISVKTLQRLDKSGELPALRSSGGRKIYTTEHIRRAMELMDASQRKRVAVSFCKKGVASMCGKVSIPKRWLEQMGVTAQCPWVEISFDGETIFVRKAEEEA